MMVDIIVASCTAPGRGALALLRLDGCGVTTLVQAMAKTSHSDSIIAAPSHSIVYGHVVDGAGRALDQVLFLIMHAPRTFTGNEVVEITCHNNPFIIEAILARACSLGARLAQPGEFAQRALMNGKIDLLQAEAIHELIMAPSRALASASLAQLEGSLSHNVAQIEARLIELAALIEASFEFSEEEHLDLDFDRVVRERLDNLISFIESMCAGQSGVQQLREGVKIALVGGVNAGKSTLLNTLLGRNRAIVSDVPGTTRDSIEAGVACDGYAWTYIDTAGLRQTTDSIEQEGIVRSRDAAALADIVLLVVDGSVTPSPEIIDECTVFASRYAHKVILILTKADCGLSDDWVAPSLRAHMISVSAHTGIGMESLREAIFNRVRAVYDSIEAPFVLNQRQLALAGQVQRLLEDVRVQCLHVRPQYELIAARVHDILSLVTELSGRSISEQVMDKVFSTFCIGK